MLGYITLLFSLSDFALSIGISSQQATDIIGYLNIGTAIGRPVIGIMSDKFDRIDVAGALTLICGLSCFAFWVPVQSYGLLVFFSLLAGAVLGVFWMVSVATGASLSHLYTSPCLLIFALTDNRTPLRRSRGT